MTLRGSGRLEGTAVAGNLVVDRIDRTARPDRIEALVDENAIQPAVEAVIGVEARQPVERLDECVLSGVCRVFRVAEHSQGHGVHHLLVSRYQDAEGVGVARH